METKDLIPYYKNEIGDRIKSCKNIQLDVKSGSQSLKMIEIIPRRKNFKKGIFIDIFV